MKRTHQLSLAVIMCCGATIGISTNWGIPKSVQAEEKTETPSIQFSEHLIADNYAYAYGIAAADFDKDGDLDLSSADYTPHNKIYLFQNDGHGQLKKHTIQEKDPVRLERHLVGDIDADGDLDIVIVKNLKGHLLWFENNGTPFDGKLWKRHIITTNLPGAYDVALADFNGDGRLDVAGSSWELGNQFAWFENDGHPKKGEWKKHLIEENIRETRTIRAADFDGDGDADLMGTARKDDVTVWYENHPSGSQVSWTKHIVDAKSDSPAHGNPADMDGDGDLDIVMSLGFRYRPNSKETKENIDSIRSEDNQVAWYENNNPRGGPWKKHLVMDKFDDSFESIAADLDGDGDMDIAATTWRNPGRVSWFENTGDPKKNWIHHPLKKNWTGANQVIIADMDGDGKLDIIACAEKTSLEVRWWRNEGRPTK